MYMAQIKCILEGNKYAILSSVITVKIHPISSLKTSN